MADFVNAIAYTLRRWNHNHGTGGNLGWEYYHDMAWGGLYANDLFMDEFREHNPNIEDRNRIKNRIENEATNGADAKGDKCF